MDDVDSEGASVKRELVLAIFYGDTKYEVIPMQENRERDKEKNSLK